MFLFVNYVATSIRALLYVSGVMFYAHNTGPACNPSNIQMELLR